MIFQSAHTLYEALNNHTKAEWKLDDAGGNNAVIWCHTKHYTVAIGDEVICLYDGRIDPLDDDVEACNLVWLYPPTKREFKENSVAWWLNHKCPEIKWTQDEFQTLNETDISELPEGSVDSIAQHAEDLSEQMMEVLGHNEVWWEIVKPIWQNVMKACVVAVHAWEQDPYYKTLREEEQEEEDE